MKLIDGFLDNITMYRLMLYYLIGLVVAAVFFSFLGILPYSTFGIVFSVLFLLAVSLITNSTFSKTFKAPTNVESVYISALILALIITPAKSFQDLMFLGWAAVWTMASKYIFAIGKKHLFNPVAIAVTITAYALNQSATWWIGNLVMLPFVTAGGLLIVRKIKRVDLVYSFLFTSMVVILGFSLLNGNDLISVALKAVSGSPLLFFAFVMLTEPLTTPPTNRLQIYYGVLVGFLFAPQVHFGAFYTTPEISLIIGNLFSYLVSPKQKLILKLKDKIRVSFDIYDFIFSKSEKLAFEPGQYLEWTLPHSSPDERGNRRYFTIASSPTEDDLRIGVKFYEKSSSFKKSLWAMNGDNEIVASGLSGDFTLPKDPGKKCVFIAGGIGITPFRSMFKYLLDVNQKRPIVLFYANKTASEIVYKDVFDKAYEELGIKTVYTLSDMANIPSTWLGKIGRINEEIIREEVPDYTERTFYLSGPHTMVVSFERVLKAMGLKKEQIITDYFPGFA